MSLETQTLTGDPSQWDNSLFTHNSFEVIVAAPPFRAADIGLSVCLGDLPNGAKGYLRWIRGWMTKALKSLKPGGHFYVYGLPNWLPHFLEPLQQELEFKYWFGVRSYGKRRSKSLVAEHMALAFFAKPAARFACNKVRYPHPICPVCNRTVKDYGGRAHLLNPEGCLISDVWKDFRPEDVRGSLPAPVLERILGLSDAFGQGRALILKPSGQEPPALKNQAQLELQYGGLQVDPKLLDQVYQEDSLVFMNRLPDECVDLVFADPPYNLQKNYSNYSDDQEDERYLNWCREWLSEYARILKPGGAMMILNLPKWGVYHARELSRHLHLRNWIVWDAHSEPKGKVNPVHYSLLYFTKGPTPRVFNYASPGNQKEFDVSAPVAPIYCRRIRCRKKRKINEFDDSAPLTDIWSDVHRLRHRRDRDQHPCQLPDALMDRIIELTTMPGDTVIDAFCGAGTTAISAHKLGRRFIGIEIDEKYVELAREKMVQVNLFGEVPKQRVKKGKRSEVMKKDLQLELVRLARELKRTPTREDVVAQGKYPIDLYNEAFTTWSKALGAVRVMVKSD
ncbi:MAG: DNA methyltransferase [Planctomycetota bacterium]|nr:DNA methyltransferase [Planctomycetota bacterium]MDA1142125.1 DNA methyltransferase [Planctomycetota bacterium]